MKVVWHKVVLAYKQALPAPDQKAIDNLVTLIGMAPLDGELLRSDDRMYYQRSYDLDRTRWPHGVRVLYRIIDLNKVEVVAIEDIGDHYRSARHGKSVYADERARAR